MPQFEESCCGFISTGLSTGKKGAGASSCDLVYLFTYLFQSLQCPEGVTEWSGLVTMTEEKYSAHGEYT